MGKKFEVVVSGISGMFPESNSVPDLKKFLYEKTNLVTTSEDRWRPGHLGAPSAIGKLSVANKFDLAFFGVNRLLAEAMDPLTSIGLKCAFEAVCDAGINPGELSETRTAVVFGSVISESELHFTMKCATGYGMMGRARTMNANRISYYFNAKGPSVVIGCTWEESLEILSVASQLISEGHAVAAIVGVTNMITSPEVSFAIDCMGRLTQGNQTKSFSNDADGYNRSEACVVFFLQRADHARRSYGSVVKVLSTNFGSREQTITGHSPDLYTRFLRQAYDGIDRTKLGFVELDGSANKNTDAMELNTANEVINEGREKPLLVGSIKSNLGHTETASGFVSIVKALIALDTGIIPPNLHFSQPNTGSPALTQGKLQVVTEPTPLEGNLIGVSSIGLMGCYGHVVLKQNPKPKPANRIDDLPRLVVMSGREEEGLEEAFKKVESMPVDEEFVALLHHVFKKKIPNHYCRGYGVIGGTNPIRNIQYSPESAKRPLWFVFSGMGSQWPGMGTSLMKLPTFAEAIQKCHAALEPKGVDLINILTNPDPSTFDSILNSFVGIAAVQIGLVDVLRALGITPDGIVGHSVGELGCAYADGCFTAEQMILSAHARGRASIETELVRGKMAAVGMGYDEIKNMIPSSIEVACHNAGDSCTLSGPDKDVEEFVGQLKAKGVFAKLVNVGNIAYHSRYIRPAAPALLKYLEEVIPTPKPRSATWISSSLPKSQWDSPVAKNSSAEYHTNNLLSPVLFHEAAKEIPADAIVIEIAPHGLLQAILKRSHSSCVNIPLTNKSSKEGLEYLLQSIGRLYLEGVDVDISNIYPKIEFPVSRNTPAIHNLITWSEKQQIESLYKREDEEDIIIDSDGSNGWESLCSQNKINGIEIVPSSVRLNSVIELAKGENETSGKLIHFKNIIFNEAAEIRPTNECETGIQFLKGTGNFEIYRKSPIIKGYLSLDDNVELLGVDEFDVGGNVKLVVKQDFYEYFESVGFEKGEAFQNVEEITIGDNGVSGKVVWNGNWTIFLDALFQIISFYSSMRETKLRLTSNVRNLIFNLDQFTTPNYEVHVVYDVNMQVLRCEGVLFDGIRTTYCNITKPSELKYEEPAFVPYSGSYLRDLYDGITISVQLLFENTARSKVRLFSINGDPKVVQLISDCFQEQGIFQLAITEILDNDLIEHLDLNELQDETCLIVTNNSSDKKALDLFDSLKEGFLLSSDSQLCKMPNTIQSSVLLEFHSNDFDLTFLKKESPFELDSIGIVDFSKGQWEENIESLGRRSVAGAKRTYVVDNFTSELSMYNNIKEYQRLLKDKTIRFFLLESSCPKFSPSSQFYEAQIKKDLAVNVYRRGEWGTIRSLRFSPDLLKKSITKLPEKKQFHGFNFDCFGLNLKDEFGQQSSPNTKLGTLEYSGVDGKGKALFGCCSLTEYEFFKRDPILYWEKPDSWTFEQAATVPHAYAIAYSIMSNQIVSYRKTDVFINDGLSPISMAMISIVLSQGIIPYTTYKSEEEKEKIKEIFPQLIDDNMVSHKDAQYGYKILEKTGNEGVSLSINTTDDYRHLKACISCASFRGQFVQVNSRLLNDNNSFGMGWFLKERGCSGIHPDYIINLPDAKKLLIKEEIKRGIETGVVRPLPLQVTKAKEQIHRFIQSNEGCKVVLRNDENAEKRNEYYRCNSDNGYLIVGSNKGFWVDIILWLVQRGALVFCVVFDSEHMSVSNEIRLNSILLQHPNVKIHFLQREKFSSTSAAKSTLFGWSKFYPLASVFVLEKMDKNYLKHLGEAVRELAPKCQVICFETNEWLYEDRCNQGFPTLLIKLGNSIKKPSLILPSLDYLILKMGKIQHIVYISDKTNLCNPGTGVKIPMQKYNFMPKHTGELEDFSLCLGERACFEEVDTLCPRYSVAREFQPFFIVPGLKPNQMDAITSKLLCPAFQVKLPERITSLQTTAEDLVRDLSKFGQTKFTIIASDWGIALALKITELLELKGCSALLVLLGSEPSSVEVCAETMLENNGNKIINKYFKNSPVYQQLNSVNDWDAKLDLLFSDHHMKNLTRNSVLRSGLNAIKNRFEAILSFSVKKEITSKALYIKPRGYTNDSVAALQKHFNEPLKFSETEDVDFEQLSRSPQLAKSINSYGLFEYKDCAKETDYKFDQLFYPSQDFDKSVCAIKIQHKNFDDMNSSLLNCMQTNVAKILL